MPKDAGTDVVSETQDPQQILYKTLPDMETLSRESMGKAGANYISTTAANVDGAWGCITALEDTVFTTLTSSNWTGSTANLPLKTGVTIYGAFSRVNLQSGKVVAYNAA